MHCKPHSLHWQWSLIQSSPEALQIVEKELEREINTRKEKGNGWLDDLNK